MKIKCLNCGHEFHGPIIIDKLGECCTCKKCGSTFDGPVVMLHKGHQNKVLGRRCYVKSVSGRELNEGYIIGFNNGKYEIRLTMTGNIVHVSNVYLEIKFIE